MVFKKILHISQKFNGKKLLLISLFHSTLPFNLIFNMSISNKKYE